MWKTCSYSYQALNTRLVVVQGKETVVFLQKYTDLCSANAASAVLSHWVYGPRYNLLLEAECVLPSRCLSSSVSWTLLECDGGTRLGFTSRCLLFFSLVFLTLFHHLFSSTLLPRFFFPPLWMLQKTDQGVHIFTARLKMWLKL